MVPGVASADEARAIVRASKYRPEGNRGLVDMLRYRQRDSAMYARLNRETLVVVQIEGVAAAAQAAEIVAVPGVDVAFVGALDLSQSAGTPGDFDSAAFATTISQLLTDVAAGGAGKQLGIYAPTLAAAQHFRGLGFGFITYSTEALLLYEACRAVPGALGLGRH
jgi:2-keto-3-deoxy-L-rhamnonate aldolase RhmA